MDEQQRRWYRAVESQRLGYGHSVRGAHPHGDGHLPPEGTSLLTIPTKVLQAHRMGPPGISLLSPPEHA